MATPGAHLVQAQLCSRRAHVFLGSRHYLHSNLDTELIVSFEGRGNHTFIALAEHFEKVKETPEEIFSQLALQNAPPEKPLGDRLSE